MVKYLVKRMRRKARTLYYKVYGSLFVDYDKIVESEKNKFLKLCFSEDDGIKKLDSILERLTKRCFNRSIDSVHWLLFSCLSLKDDRAYRILEIGTGNGFSTRILSELFKSSEIITVDLPQHDSLIRSFYGREKDNKLKDYIETQKNNTSSPRIKAIKTNSFFLLDKVDGLFDIIWVDGGHLYPDVAWDICNAYHLCKEGGYILIDDVILLKKEFRTKLVSTDSSKVINYICERTNADVTYFLKRVNAESESAKHRKKYVACIKILEKEK